VTIATSPHQSTVATLQREIREMAIRGEERGIGYIIFKIDIRPPLQEKRGGGSVTIGTSMNKSSEAILQRENEKDGNQRRVEERDWIQSA
jgi:hypothetical protein